MEYGIFPSIGFSLCALLYIIFIIIMYYSKKKYKNIENTIFLSLVLLTIIQIIIEFSFVKCLSDYDNLKTLAIPMCRLYICGSIIWIGVMSFYILVQLTRKYDVEVKKWKRKKILISLIIVTLILLTYSSFLSIDLHYVPDGIYTFTGDAKSVKYIFSFVLAVEMFYGLIIKDKSLTSLQKAPIYFAIIFLALSTIYEISAVEPFNIQNFQFATIIMALFFTFESQDSKLLLEHQESKNEAEKANK